MKNPSINQCHRIAFFLVIAACINATAIADIAPLSVEQLEIRADAIVVATIEAMRIESEPSRFENGFGNSDWGIYLTLGIEDIVKGSIREDVMEARCFRIRSRRSAAEYLSPSGHHPIPKAGSLVRVYMEQDGNQWNVLLPNGIASVDGDLLTGSLEDALEVAQLRSLGYTFGLPMEIWTMLIAVGLPLLLATIVFVRRLRRRQVAAVTCETHELESRISSDSNA